MFLGEYNHSLDAKGRLILPARFRDQLDAAYVTSEVDKCLALWPPDEFEIKAIQMKERLRGSAADRNVARVFFAGAQEASPDRQGRLAIPNHLRAFAGLDREVTVTGQFDHIEIWDAAVWQEKKVRGEEGLAEGGGG